MNNKWGLRPRIFLFGILCIFFSLQLFGWSFYLLSSWKYTHINQQDLQSLTEKIIQTLTISTNHVGLSSSDVSFQDIPGIEVFISQGQNIQDTALFGFSHDIFQEKMILKTYHQGYHIVVKKDMRDFFLWKKIFFEIYILGSGVGIGFMIIVWWFLIGFIMKPFYEILIFLQKLDIKQKKVFLKNNYSSGEIKDLIDELNHFLYLSFDIITSQKYFIQDVSHELKTPLMQIESSLDLLDGKITDTKLKQKLDHIKASVQNINIILSNLSFLLRGEEALVTKEKINMQKYIDQKIKTYEVLAGEKNIIFSFEVKNNFSLESNYYYIDRIFDNLFSNALYYNKGNNTIFITLEKGKIIIKDQGIGIDRDEIDKIFQRFYRNKNSTLYAPTGNGLGLAIVKKITDMFGWKLTLSSQLGEGTSIEIVFGKEQK